MEKTLTNSDFLKTYQTTLVYKAERVVTALYLVSSLMIDQEPLKWQIRNLALETLHLAHKGINTSLVNSIDDLISSISLAGRSALMSQMNVDLLDKGLRAFRQSISETEMVGEDFLKLERRERHDLNAGNYIKDKKDIMKNPDFNVFYKGQTSVSKNMSNRKDKRRNLVLESLKRKGDSSIKDIVRQVKGCSEKTIQRELNTLISEGLVNKKGERRWSVYSLI